MVLYGFLLEEWLDGSIHEGCGSDNFIPLDGRLSLNHQKEICHNILNKCPGRVGFTLRTGILNGRCRYIYVKPEFKNKTVSVED